MRGVFTPQSNSKVSEVSDDSKFPHLSQSGVATLALALASLELISALLFLHPLNIDFPCFDSLLDF
jgi:hypothetical protein